MVCGGVSSVRIADVCQCRVLTCELESHERFVQGLSNPYSASRCPMGGMNTTYFKSVKRLSFLGTGIIPEIMVTIKGKVAIRHMNHGEG